MVVQLGIAVSGDAVELLPVETARRVAELSELVTIIINDPAAQAPGDDPDDPYSEYKVPDDLIW